LGITWAVFWGQGKDQPEKKTGVQTSLKPPRFQIPMGQDLPKKRLFTTYAAVLKGKDQEKKQNT